MQAGKPSRTALAAAAHRAAHQVLEHGRIFTDPLALTILGDEADALVQRSQDWPASAKVRMFIAARTRFAEDALAAAIARGARQLVVLGAGLDTYAYRSHARELVHVFEVDHPATQAWKREQLAAAGIPVPRSLTFAPVDFERETLAAGLTAAGFDPSHPTFFTWLGVVKYLTEPAVWTTLELVASLPGGADVVFDYSDPPATLTPERRAVHDERARNVAALGEAWESYFEPAALHARLAALGLVDIEDLGPRQIAARYFPEAAPPSSDRGGHVIRAGTGTPV